MKVIIAISIVVVLGAVLLAAFRTAPVYSVTARDLPSVVAKLHGLPTGKHGTWVVFMFQPPGAAPSEDAVNLQYSVENGVVGLDWVLLSKRNIADKEAVKAYIEGRGFAAPEMEMNKVRYLRIVGPGIDQLGVGIVSEFYGLPLKEPLEFHTEGFEWSGK